MTTKFFKVRARVVYEAGFTVEAHDEEGALLEAREYFDCMYSSPDTLDVQVLGEEVVEDDEY